MNNRYNCDIDLFCKTIREKELKVIGLTNYFIIHEHEYQEIITELGNDVYVIPNIEFRTNDINGSGEYINIHVLFNPETISIKSINDTLARIELNNIASSTSVYCNFESINSIGFDKVTISVDALVTQLKKDFNSSDYLIIGVPNGYGGFHPSSKPRSVELAKKLDELSHIMFGRKEDTEFFLSTDNGRAKLGFKSKPNIVCSDAHSIGDIGSKSTWIKSQPVFEGLKQILFEPKYRVDCNDTIRKPYRTINSIKLNFPKNTMLRNTQTNTEQLFCLTNLREEIFFSPYFTCIIGGRGSGKSTIINLIAQQLGEKSDFFEDNKIMVEKKDILKNDGKEYITISGTNEIEFISQGKVEELSSGNRLTDLIFNERIKAVGNDYVEKEKLLKAKLLLIDEKIKGITELEVLRANVSTKKVSLENDKKIVASIENDTYKDLSKKVKETTEKIESINRNKEKYSEFFETLTELCLAIDIENSSDEYSSRLIEIVDYIDKLDEITRLKDENGIGYKTSLKTFPDTDTLLEDKKAELATFKQQIVDYFTSIGSTPDSIADVDRATFNIATIAKEIEELEKKMLQKAEQIKKLNEQIAGLKEMANECEQIIIRRLEAINKDLDISNDNVEKISFKYDFSWEKYRNRLYQTFKEHFQHYHKTGLSWDNVAGCLDQITPDESFLNLNYEQFLEQVEQKSFDRNLLYVKVFSEIFDSQYNFIIYKSMIKKNLYSVSENVQITGYYGKLPLTSCSFGQRCTAVVVTLLMTGVKPLLIDEPEAHLDNRLIAEYLVDLIKEKKNERQIIFATHNANFVVNGDSELIHILEIPKEKVFTEIISTTIEDLSNRKSLLKLEGGEEAFKKRDRKLLSGFVS
ncbi:AAA family ATPase [Elizabethkingia anophelis]|nr:AAA family ATPase [Elizabethkingia anophelis]MDV2461107.1 AAA family ATPase [Elizabethkingia anophelis]MDV3475439.1 AAA family ATPase [Elizabethkingia anophelis]MDV3994580.1 AAA family ATPase [Elizabethkingia anophelis]MDV4072563.1 AAA family ATPase [Elizabethkingia anophelis]